MSNKLIKITIMIFALLMSVGVIFAGGSLNVVLANQNPDPVSPGGFVYVNLKVSNSGKISSENVKVSMMDNSQFKIAPGTDSFKNIGIIPPFSYGTTSTNFVIVKFKLKVSQTTPSGLNTLTFFVEDTGVKYKYNFEILVEEKNPTLKINTFQIKPIKAGESQKLSIELENSNSVILKNIQVMLGIDKLAIPNLITVGANTNRRVIDNLNAGEKVTLDFQIIGNPTAVSGIYNLPIDFTFKDNSGKNYTQTMLGSIKIFSKPTLSVNLASQDSFALGPAKVNLAIANPGTSAIKGVEMEILKSNDYEVISGAFEYVGNLNPDDFQTLQSNVYFNVDKNFNLKLKLKYLDSFNTQKEEIREIPIRIYNKDEVAKFGGGSQSSSSFSTVVIVIITALIFFFIGRKVEKRSSNKNSKK